MIARLSSLLLAAAVVVAGCSSNVDPSPHVTDPERITVLPATATLYSGLPTKFVLSGGTGSYIVTSSNQAVVPISGNVLTKSFIVIPSPVSTETPVTITVRDTGTTPLASATLTVRPNTVANNITITPTGGPTGNPDCAPAICTGTDAEVSVVISQGGVPLAARGVRFEVVTGDFRYITTPAGVPEVLGLTVTTTTDETGRARARFRATAMAPTQTATLRIVDTGSDAYQTSSFTIAQFTGNAEVFFLSPQTVTLTGPRTGVCASNASSQVAVYGGTPPYTVSGSGAAFVATPVGSNGSGGFLFTVTATGVCSAGTVFSVADATGRVVTMTAVNEPGTEDAPAFVVSPTEVSLSGCGSNQAAYVVAGGGVSQNLIAASGSPLVLAEYFPPGRVRIYRDIRTPPQVWPTTTPPTVVNVGISDGVSTVNVEVSAPGGSSC